MSSYPKDYFSDRFQVMNNSYSLNCQNAIMSSQEIKTGAVNSSMEHFNKRNKMKQNDNPAFNCTIDKDGKEKSGTVVNGKTIQNGIISDEKHMSKSSFVNDKCSENVPIVNTNSLNRSIMEEHPAQKASIVNGEHAQNGYSNSKQAQNGSFVTDKHVQNGLDGMYMYMTTTEEFSGSNSSNKVLKANRSCIDHMSKNDEYSCSQTNDKAKMDGSLLSSEILTDSYSLSNLKRPQTSVVITEKLTAAVLKDLFEDKICVLHIPNYVPQVVCDTLDSFLRDKGSDQYTHEVRKDGRADLLYFGVNRYGFPLNSTYNDTTGKSMERYFSEALPTMQSIRNAVAPYLSPIDKLRVELDETWSRKVNVATLNGQKTFCGIGRIMPASLSELSADQPHFDAVPTTYFPDIHKQFAANIYLNVPEEGGELEIWDVPPVDVENVENFTIPKNWRSQLPPSIKVKPGTGDLLLLNTRRPHAITKFAGDRPRTSIQSFIGLTKESDVFLWV